MKLLKNIHWTAFVLSFLVGLAYTMYLDPKQSITVYPTPDNVDQIQYKDHTGTTFVYQMNKVKCPEKSKITEYPIQ